MSQRGGVRARAESREQRAESGCWGVQIQMQEQQLLLVSVWGQVRDQFIPRTV